MPAAAEPIRPDELDGLFARFFPAPAAARTALAVSGGSDSTALIVLFADWLRQPAFTRDTRVTVDHGLRPDRPPGPRRDAGATALGLPHAIRGGRAPSPRPDCSRRRPRPAYRLIASTPAPTAIVSASPATRRRSSRDALMRPRRASSSCLAAAPADRARLRGADACIRSSWTALLGPQGPCARPGARGIPCSRIPAQHPASSHAPAGAADSMPWA